MTLQDLLSTWQAQPFRPFRLHTARGSFDIAYPLMIGLASEDRIAVVTPDGQAEFLSLDEIDRCEINGAAVALAEAIGRIPPATLAYHAQVLAAALQTSVPERKPKQSATTVLGPVDFVASQSPEGLHWVHATVNDRDGNAIFSTTGTRWNLHGIEAFENGTSLYLHHPDHPDVEQRVIIWPPDNGTFESFSEGKPLHELEQELKKRDAQLTAKPSKRKEPEAKWFRAIIPTYEKFKPDGEEEAFGANPAAHDFDRYEFHLVSHAVDKKQSVHCPCLFDIPAERILFNLTETNWDATFTREPPIYRVSLRYAGRERHMLSITIDPLHLTARVEGDATELPLGFVERHLRNYALYSPWDDMVSALRAGPVAAKHPDVVLPLANGFLAELWAGETRFPLPFLQPCFRDPNGQALLDLRATTWAAAIEADPKTPTVTLRLVSHEADNRWANPKLELSLDLVSQRVTCRGHKGSTSLGMVQALVRHVRGTQWLSENLPEWFKKGRSVPLP